MKKSQNMPGCLRKMVLAQQNSTVCGGWWKVQQRCAPAEKSVINMIWLLFSVSDRPIIMIGPVGFTLRSSPPVCYPSFTFMGGVAKKYITKLGCEKIFSQGHILSSWRCFKLTMSPLCEIFLVHQSRLSTFLFGG